MGYLLSNQYSSGRRMEQREQSHQSVISDHNILWSFVTVAGGKPAGRGVTAYELQIHGNFMCRKQSRNFIPLLWRQLPF
jgi:hypothetical protein